jgi:hypothetical protein
MECENLSVEFYQLPTIPFRKEVMRAYDEIVKLLSQDGLLAVVTEKFWIDSMAQEYTVFLKRARFTDVYNLQSYADIEVALDREIKWRNGMSFKVQPPIYPLLISDYEMHAVWNNPAIRIVSWKGKGAAHVTNLVRAALNNCYTA